MRWIHVGSYNYTQLTEKRAYFNDDDDDDEVGFNVLGCRADI